MRLLILFLILGIYTADAQNDPAYVESLTTEHIKKLQEAGAENVFAVFRECMGDMRMFEIGPGKYCSSRDSYVEAVVFYVAGGEQMLTKIDNCGMFNPVQLTEDKIFVHYLLNRETLIEQQLKPYETDIPYTDTKSRTIVYRCHREYRFFDSEQTIVSSYKERQLTNDPEHPNKNYYFNKSHPLVSLDDLIDQRLMELDIQRKLVRQ